MIYRSKHIDNHLNPLWDPFTFSLEEICNGDLNWPLKVSVVDYNASGQNELIGQFETTLQELLNRVGIKGNADRDKAFEIFVEGRDKAQGLLCVVQAELHVEEGPADTPQSSGQEGGGEGLTSH